MELAHKLFSTRGGTFILAGFAALLAALVVLVYLHKYRSSVKLGGEPATVLVAKQPIQKGTTGAAIASEHMFQAQTFRQSQLPEGAISDPSSFAGRVAARDIQPSEKLKASDFVLATNSLVSQLTSNQRAMTLPIDAAHGLIGQVHTGDHVDVYAGFNVVPVDRLGRPLQTGGQPRAVLRLVVQNVPVVAISSTGKPGVGGSNNESDVTLKVTPAQAGELAFASDNGKVWLVLRPPNGRPVPGLNLVTMETVLLGIPPVTALRSFGGQR
jgi:Flp pilus assembly protein CpaB